MWQRIGLILGLLGYNGKRSMEGNCKPEEPLEKIARRLGIGTYGRHLLICADQTNPKCAAREITNQLRRSSTLTIAEGLGVIRMPVPRGLAGTSIAGSGIRPRTGCSVVAVSQDGTTRVNPDPAEALPPGGEIILIATAEGERLFLKEFSD